MPGRDRLTAGFAAPHRRRSPHLHLAAYLKAAQEIMREYEQNGPNEALQERAERAIERFDYLRTHFQHHVGRHLPRSLDNRANEHVSDLKGVVSAGHNEASHEQGHHRDYSRVTNGAIVIHTQRLKSDPGGNLLS